MDNEKVYAMPFGKVYPLLVSKAEKRTNQRRSRPDHMLADGLYSRRQLSTRYTVGIPYGDFFRNAPKLNPNRKLIKGNRLRRARGGDCRAPNAGNTVSR